MRNCDFENLPECDVVWLKKLPGIPAFTEDGTGNESFKEYYKVVLGGADPCACGDVYWDKVKKYDDAEYGGDTLPQRGDQKVIESSTYIVDKLTVEKEIRSATKDQCRTTCIVVTWVKLSGGADLPAGTGRLPAADIPEYPCRLKFKFGNETVPAENAQWFGFYDYKGSYKVPSWRENNYVCLPLRQQFSSIIPITNSAGVPFDPPLTIQRNTTKILVARPFLQVNVNYIDTLKNTINCDDFFALEFRNGVPTRGMKVKPYTAKVTDVNIADDYTIDTGAYFTWVTLELTIRSNKIRWVEDDGFGGTIVLESQDFGWDDLVANTGLATLRFPGEQGANGDIVQPNRFPALTGGTVEAILDKDGSPITDPMFLSENGITWKQERTQADEAAVLAGGVCSAGRPKEDIVYLRWRHYDAVKYASNQTLPSFYKNGIWPATQDNGLPAEHFPNWAASGDLSGTILADFSPELCEFLP